MRLSVAVVFAAITVAACTDAPVGPRQPLQGPTVQLSHLGESPATVDLCGGLSPCDAYDYRGDGSTGAPGICFLPPTVDNHLSDLACSAPNQPGLSGIFELAWCRVIYTDSTGMTPPTIATKTDADGNEVPDCQDPADWQPLVEESDHYVASVQWKHNEADVDDVFRLYVVRGEQMFAHRDVLIHPNFETPADNYVEAIGFGNDPVKLRINDDFSCIKYDTQEGTPENAATCLITGETSIQFDTDELDVTFNFHEGNDPFLADFEVSECLSLGFYVDPGTNLPGGNALVDTPLADCKISLSSEEVEVLDVPAQLIVTLTDGRWGTGGPFEHARLNVLEYDEMGLGALPPAADPGWLGMASSSSAAVRWLGRGLDMLASLVLPEKAYAALGTGAGWNVSRMSDLQISVMPMATAGSLGVPCASGDAFCTDLGSFPTGTITPVSVHVTAPDTSRYPGPDDYLDVPDTRLHFFPETGVVSCPVGSAQDALGRGCVEPGDPDMSTTPPSYWPDHVVVVTGTDGMGTGDWHLADGDNVLHVAACGVSRDGPHEPDAVGGDHVWGELGDCSNRELSMDDPTAYDNGPADGFTPFEPVDTENEAAVYGLALEFLAGTCPDIVVDGVMDGNEWSACASAEVFTAPLKGPKVTDNATLFTYTDGTTLYIGLEVQTDDVGDKIFVAFTDAVANSDGVEAVGDEILVLDFSDGTAPLDWHNTQSCLSNNSASLCGDPDAGNDGSFAADAAATVGGAGAGTVFYEFSRPLGSPGAAAGPGKEDLGAQVGDQIGLRLVVTQGKGGGKGGFVFPDPQTSANKYYVFTME